jgi:hypothetical protein
MRATTDTIDHKQKSPSSPRDERLLAVPPFLAGQVRPTLRDNGASRPFPRIRTHDQIGSEAFERLKGRLRGEFGGGSSPGFQHPRLSSSIRAAYYSSSERSWKSAIDDGDSSLMIVL